MTTRACDFSSFKRPPRPPASSSSSLTSATSRPYQNAGQNSYSTTPRFGDNMSSIPRKYMKSHSVDQNSITGSIRDVASPSLSSFSPAPVTTFSTQNIDKYSSSGHTPSNTNLSTIDRTTLPYDHKRSTPNNAPPLPDRDSPLQRFEKKSSGSGSGMIYVDGGRREMMPTNSQHSLNGTLSGHPIDRSLVHRQNSYSAQNSFDCGYDGGYGTHPGLPHYATDVILPNNNYPPSYHTAQHTRGANIYSQSPDNNYARHENIIRPQRSPHNVSSGESGIAGCDFNTLGTRSYEPVPDSMENYVTAAPSSAPAYPNHREPIMSGSLAALRRGHNEEAQTNYDTQPRVKMTYPSGDHMSNGGSHRSTNTAESSLTARGDTNQQTHLLVAGSENPLNTSADENSIAIFDHPPSVLNSSSYRQQQYSVPKISTRSSSRGSYKKGFNLFKKKSKSRTRSMTNDIYTGNNLYGPNDKKSSSKYSSKVMLGNDGGTTTGIPFGSSHNSKKRPFCPKWHCILLTLAISFVLLLMLGLFIYFYVWPSILQPLVKSSQPVDGQWGSWKPWFQCSATCGQGIQNRTRECNSPNPEDGGKFCEGRKYEMRKCNAPIECPDCTRICDVGTLSDDCRSCTCEGHVITGKITDEFGNPLPGVKIYKDSGATLLLSGTDLKGEFTFEGVCSNGNNDLRLEKEMYRTSTVRPKQSETNKKEGFVVFAMIKLYLPTFVVSPTNEQRLVGQKVILCCEAESEQPPTQYVWFKDNSRLDATVYRYNLQQPSLILSDLMEWDSGEYTCQVRNEAGTVNSEPATLTVYGNWTELCNPTPADKMIELPKGCSQKFFNTGTCDNDNGIAAVTNKSGTSSPQCIAPSQYPENTPNDICRWDASTAAERPRSCCVPVETEEINVSCTLEDVGQDYSMAFKRVLSCGCVPC